MKKKMNSTFNLLSSFATKVGKTVGNYTARNINKKKEEPLTYEQQLSQSTDKIKNILLTIINTEDESATDDLFQNLELLEKTLQKTISLFFDKQTFNQDSFQILIESQLVPILTAYINVDYINSLTKIIFPFLYKLIFANEPLSNVTEEIFIMNNQIIQCIKQLIIEFVNIINEINNMTLTQDIFDFIEEGMIPFLNDFVLKLIIYQNFYEKISANNPNFNFELFDIFITLFKYEQQIKNREVKSLLRKNLLTIINFFKINESEKGVGYFKKLIANTIYNLTEYYINYLELSNKEIDNSYKLFNDLPLALTENEILKLNSEDVISYIKFFNMLSYNFSSKNDLKEFFFTLLINNFFCENILEEIINLSNDISYQLRSVLLIEYLYYFVKYINNISIQESIFYFLFGINSEQKDIDEDENISNNKEKAPNIKIKNIFEKSNHNFESIRAFFTMIIESDSTNQFPLLMKTLCILAKKLPYIFMTEIIVPYYLYNLYKIIKSEKDFDNLIDNLIKNKEFMDIIEILKTLAPQYVSIDTHNWINYFTKNLKLNSNRSLIILDQMDTSDNNQEFINDSSILNKSDNGNNMNYFFGNILNASNLSFSDNNESILSAKLDLNDNNNIESDIKISEDNKYSYLFNSYIISSRVKFVDTLIKKLKKFVNNNYNENLYISEFFMEIASFLPPIGKSNELKQLYNIYTGITYAKKSNEKLFGLSIIGILYNIKCQIDKKVKANFNTEEIGNLCSILDDPNQKWEDVLLLNNEYGVDMYQKLPILKNVKLYNELIKDFISNIFTKQIIGQKNDFWEKCINKNNKKI